MMHADLERNVKQQIEADGGADHFGQVGRGDGDFRRQPQRPRHPARKGIAAGLREVAPGADAEPRAQRLQHDRHQIGQQRDEQQRVAEFGAAGERGRPVAGIHVADRDEIARTQERQQLAPERPLLGRLHRREHARQRRLAASPRQPEPSRKAFAGRGREIRRQNGRSSIHSERWRIVGFIATHLQVHLAARIHTGPSRRKSWVSSGSGWVRVPPARHVADNNAQEESAMSGTRKRSACPRPSTVWPGPISPRNRPSRSRWPPHRSSRCCCSASVKARPACCRPR